MPDQLEALVRDALRSRASGIATDIPPYPSAPPARLRTAALAGVSALVVIALVIGGVLVFGRSSGGRTATGSTNSYAGTSWTLRALTADGKAIQLPGGGRGTLAFPSKIQINLDDSVNFMSGQYEVTSSGFVTRNIASTAVGYDGSDPNRAAMIAAIDAVGYRLNDTTNTNPVAAHLDGDQLVITAGKYVLTFARTGNATPAPTAAGTEPAASSSINPNTVSSDGPYIGTGWTLAALTENGTEVSLPATPRAALEFRSSSVIWMDDTINYLSGDYEITATGFSTREIMLTAVAGADSSQRSAIDAIGSGDYATGTTVQAELTGGQLIITTGKYVLTFDPAATSTPDPTGRGDSAGAGGASGSVGSSGSASAGANGSGGSDGSTSPGNPGATYVCGTSGAGGPPC